MSDFLFACSQMGMSLGFHIVFAAIGIALPVLMAIAEGMYLTTKRPVSWKRRGAIIGMPFSIEGFAFFTEAIFLGHNPVKNLTVAFDGKPLK